MQGSILGVMEHNAVLESIDDEYDQRTEKYVDDLTIYEPIPMSRPSLIMEDGTGKTQAIRSQRSLRKRRNM